MRLRDNHRKALKLRQTRSGQAATNMKPPKFHKELTFLIPYLFDEEERTTNILTERSDSILEVSEVEELSEDNAVEVQNAYNDMSQLSSTPSIAVSNRKNKRRPVTAATSSSSVASVFENYLRKKQKTQTTSDDPLMNFFMSMAQTVKTFPLPDQIEIKRKLFENVNATEMRIATSDSNTREYYENAATSIRSPQQHPIFSDETQDSTYYKL